MTSGETGEKRKVTIRDIAIGVFILITTGLVVGILLQGFLSVQ